MAKIKKFRGSHVLIVGAGFTIKEYKEKIDKFIEDNDVIIIGCNNISHLFVPNYHLWTDIRRYYKYGKNINSKSICIYGDHFKKSVIQKYNIGRYGTIKYSRQKWSKHNDNPHSPKYGKSNPRYDKKQNKFYGVFRAVGSLAILWSHIRKASKISIVGMDGYTLYSSASLSKKNVSQHCYSKGFSDRDAQAIKNRKKSDDQFYKFCIQKDDDIYRTLKGIKRYGVNFEIITPTVYKQFYNKDVLNISE